MKTDAGPTRERFGFLLSRLARIWRRQLDVELSAHGIGYSNWVALVYLQRGGEGMQQRELADYMGIEAPTLVRALDQLEQLGLIKRQPHPADRRAKAVFLTDAAQQDLSRLNAIARDVRADLLEGVTEHEMESCVDVIETVMDNALRIKRRHGEQ